MKNFLIATIAGLAVLFASSAAPTAEARPWRRGLRNYNQFQRQYRRSYRNPGIYRWNRRYVAPRRYVVPRYRYRGFGYPGYWYSGPRAGFYLRF